MAVRTGFEPVISAVTGQHPKPLDERTICKAHKILLIYPLIYLRKNGSRNRTRTDNIKISLCLLYVPLELSRVQNVR